jgi:hypothetical protein
MSQIREAAEELDKELRGQPWFVGIGIKYEGQSNQSLVIQTTKNPKKIKYEFAKTIFEIPIEIEKTGRPKPCI